MRITPIRCESRSVGPGGLTTCSTSVCLGTPPFAFDPSPVRPRVRAACWHELNNIYFSFYFLSVLRETRRFVSFLFILESTIGLVAVPPPGLNPGWQRDQAVRAIP